MLRSTKACVSSNTKRIRVQGLSNLAWLFAMLEYNLPDIPPLSSPQRASNGLKTSCQRTKSCWSWHTCKSAPTFLEFLADCVKFFSFLSEYMGLDIFNMVYDDPRHSVGIHIDRLLDSGPTTFPLGQMYRLVQRTQVEECHKPHMVLCIAELLPPSNLGCIGCLV